MPGMCRSRAVLQGFGEYDGEGLVAGSYGEILSLIRCRRPGQEVERFFNYSAMMSSGGDSEAMYMPS